MPTYALAPPARRPRRAAPRAVGRGVLRAPQRKPSLGPSRGERHHRYQSGSEAGRHADRPERHGHRRHAIAVGAILVTNNTREFERVPGLVLEDWVK